MARLLDLGVDGFLHFHPGKYEKLLVDKFPAAELYSSLTPGMDYEVRRDRLRELEEANYSINAMESLLGMLSRSAIDEFCGRTYKHIFVNFSDGSTNILSGHRFDAAEVAAHVFLMPHVECRNCGEMEPAFLYWAAKNRFSLVAMESRLASGSLTPLNDDRIIINRCPHCSPASFTVTSNDPTWRCYNSKSMSPNRCTCDACGGY